jgi:hypothetical protein
MFAPRCPRTSLFCPTIDAATVRRQLEPHITRDRHRA